jgi:phosphoribosylglycinamide formyltransferase-1
MIRWAAFVSGEGTNLQNFIDLESQLKSQSLSLVLANRECRAIQRAKEARIYNRIFSNEEWSSIRSIMSLLEEKEITRIFLLGFMKVLSSRFLEAWARPIINLHPSLLPAHKGLNAIQRAFEAGDAEMGVSLHEVTSELDSGQVLLQKSFFRTGRETLWEVECRIHELEREIVRDYLFALES